MLPFGIYVVSERVSLDFQIFLQRFLAVCFLKGVFAMYKLYCYLRVHCIHLE